MATTTTLFWRDKNEKLHLLLPFQLDVEYIYYDFCLLTKFAAVVDSFPVLPPILILLLWLILLMCVCRIFYGIFRKGQSEWRFPLLNLSFDDSTTAFISATFNFKVRDLIFITTTLCLVFLLFLLDHYEALFFSLMTFILFSFLENYTRVRQTLLFVFSFLIDENPNQYNFIFALFVFIRLQKQLPVS